MPELPEVQTVLDGLEAAVKDRIIADLQGYYPGTVRLSPGVPEGCFPRAFASFERRGKYMIIRLEGDLALIVHLRMTGKLVWDPSPGEILAHERARIILDASQAVHFIDIRTFGKIILCRTEEIAEYLPDLGPEPLSNEFDKAYLATALAKRKAPIKNALLDQSLVAGLGNIYVLELLYRAGIDPRREACGLSSLQLGRIVKHTKEVLAEALAANGTSVSDFRSIDDKTGDFQNFLRVYQKQECPKGHKIEVVKQAGRSSFFCPVCQK